jgi:metal-responsive CopG/Arc/MetJ family transcriptional regulator
LKNGAKLTLPLPEARSGTPRHDKIAHFKWGKAMQRVTITIDDDLDAELEWFMSTRGYDNRSEAIRDLARSGLQQAAMEISGPRPCVAALVYVYDHEARESAPDHLIVDPHPE